MEDENKQLPIEELIGKLLQDQAVLTYQLTTAIAAKLLVSNEVGGGIKTVEDFIEEVNESYESEGETDDETTKVSDV